MTLLPHDGVIEQGGVALTFSGGREVRAELLDVPGLISLLGEDGEKIVHGFLVAFAAEERFTSIADLMHMTSSVERPAVVRERNGHLLASLNFATFCEALTAIDLLDVPPPPPPKKWVCDACSAGLCEPCHQRLHVGPGRAEEVRPRGVSAIVGSGFPPWKALLEMRARWTADPFVRKLRNAFGAHLGVGELRVGLRNATVDRLVVFDRTAGERRVDATYPSVLEITLRGLCDFDGKPFEQERFSAAGRQAITDAAAFATHIEALLLAVVKSVAERRVERAGWATP